MCSTVCSTTSVIDSTTSTLYRLYSTTSVVLAVCATTSVIDSTTSVVYDSSTTSVVCAGPAAVVLVLLVCCDLLVVCETLNLA